MTTNYRYLGPEDEGAFIDLEVLSPAEVWAFGTPYLCPKCKGHGRWNLQLDAYGPGKHFQQLCVQCSGWGWVTQAKDLRCLHDYQEISQQEARAAGVPHYGSCYHVCRCTKCGDHVSFDSSD